MTPCQFAMLFVLLQCQYSVLVQIERSECWKDVLTLIFVPFLTGVLFFNYLLNCVLAKMAVQSLALYAVHGGTFN